MGNGNVARHDRHSSGITLHVFVSHSSFACQIVLCPVHSEPEQLSKTQIERLADTAEWMMSGSPGEADTFLRQGMVTALAGIVDPSGRTQRADEPEREQQAAVHTVLAHALHFGCSRCASAR